MRVSRFLMAVGMAALIGAGSMAIVSAQAKTDEDFSKLMKAVGASNGALRKATGAEQATEAEKLVTLFKDSQQFWTAHNNKEAADWSAAAAMHADGLAKAAKAGKADEAAGHLKELGGTCQTCHTKYREKTETGYAIKKG